MEAWRHSPGREIIHQPESLDPDQPSFGHEINLFCGRSRSMLVLLWEQTAVGVCNSVGAVGLLFKLTPIRNPTVPHAKQPGHVGTFCRDGNPLLRLSSLITTMTHGGSDAFNNHKPTLLELIRTESGCQALKVHANEQGLVFSAWT